MPPKRFCRTPMKGSSELQTGFYRTFRIEPPPVSSNPFETFPTLGAQAPMTKLLTIKIAFSELYCRGVSHENKKPLGQLSALPPVPNPLKSKNVLFTVVSPSLRSSKHKVLSRGPSGDRIARSCRHTGPDLTVKTRGER